MKTLRSVELEPAATRLTERFAELFGRRPERIAHAPGRVNLIGDHTDYNGGLCLPLALPHRTLAAVARRPDDRCRIRSTAAEPWDGRVADGASGWAAYVTGVLAALDGTGGHDVLVDSTVPVGAGLSSSAALTCSVAAAVAPEEADAATLIAAAMHAENIAVGAPTGGMDQTLALLAPASGALLLDFARTGHPATVVREVAVDLPGTELLVIDSGVSHQLSDGGYAGRRAECERAAAALGVPALSAASVLPGDPVLARRTRHVLTENERVRDAVRALDAGDAVRFGQALTASHHSLRDDFEVSCAELDALVDAALAAGALGARMTGGGFGGSAVVLADQRRRDAVLAAIDELAPGRSRLVHPATGGVRGARLAVPTTSRAATAS